jgi:competence protein ComEA
MRTIALIAVTVLLAIVAAANAPQELPEGKGKTIVQKACSGCHEMDVVIGSRRTQIGWQQNVEDMVSRGAEGSAAEMEEVVAYLTKYFGKLNVNIASPAQLQEMLGWSEKEAQALLAYRERSGKLRDFEQLKTVPGLNLETLQKNRSLIAFSQ